MKVIYSAQFIKEYKRLDSKTKDKAEEKEKFFRENPFNVILKTHKLSGRLDGLWSFSVDHDCRIIFEFHSEKVIVFHAIGGHSIYKKF
jgi:addiction module RelE/StbE family toxin